MSIVAERMPTATPPVGEAVSALFVPGNRPERFAKAASSGAHVVIIDLEDAVPVDEKAMARDEAVAALRAGTIANALVRVNVVGSAEYEQDIEALLAVASRGDHGLVGIMIPKAEDDRALELLAQRLPASVRLVPLIESATGLMNAVALARVSQVARLAFGAIDLALDLNSSPEDQYLAYARTHLVVASRVARVAAPLDSPSLDIRDTAAVSASARHARNFGFGGKLCIHPAQLTPVHDAFAPTEAEIAWALLIAGAPDGASQISGQMVDRPVLERAQRILRPNGPR